MIYPTYTCLSRGFIVRSVVVCSLFFLTSTALGDPGHKGEMREGGEKQGITSGLPTNQRIIYGTIEGINENTIKVNAGEAGEMSPRYLELEKLEDKADSLKQGDRLKITVNNKNKVVDYQLANKNQ